MENELLHAWMAVEVNIRGNRILHGLHTNEMFICGLLLTGEARNAKEISDKTKLLKSQVNHIISSLEKRGFIDRQQDQTDKRRINITLTEKGKETYLKEHDEILTYVSKATTKLGEEKTRELTKLINEALSAL